MTLTLKGRNMGFVRDTSLNYGGHFFQIILKSNMDEKDMDRTRTFIIKVYIAKLT